MTQLVVYDPLPEAFAHWERQLSATLGEKVDFVRTQNEGLGRGARIWALLRHVKTARRLLRSGRPVLVTWPLLGWLEVILWASPATTVYLSVHDPRPLRRQIGLGKASAWLARRTPSRWRPKIIAYSSVALDTIRDTLPGTSITMLPLPMMPQAPQAPTLARPRRVLVLGQYKPARDLDVLAMLGSRLPQAGIAGLIAGRGWPPVAGWEVHDRFLTEAEFDAELMSAGCLLIPYQHYFQSGVAARAVELGTPVVGAEHPFLCESLGLAGTPGIVCDVASPEAWMEAISASVETHSPVDIFDEVRTRWHDWFVQAEGLAHRLT